jgi:hypothetical protein
METTQQNNDGLLAWDLFLREAGLSHTTGWRWKKACLISTININGRLYVRRSEVTRFIEAAARGDYAKPTTAPKRTKEVAR